MNLLIFTKLSTTKFHQRYILVEMGIILLKANDKDVKAMMSFTFILKMKCN